MHTEAITYRLLATLVFAFLTASVDPAKPISQAMNPDASGKAARWHGYVAREGFGITRTKNHVSDISPAMGNMYLIQ